MEQTSIDWQTIRKVHFVGVKGVAMTALAVYVKGMGIEVTGSDVSDEFPTDSVLKNATITPFIGFSPEHVKGADLVIYTGAHNGRENPEVTTAISLSIPVLPHGKALGFCMQGKRQVSVAGCHGKTTTTGMIATILTYAGLDPSYAIGCGEIRGLGLPGHFGTSDVFVAEADEYVTDPKHDKTPRFLWQNPDILVVTNVDFDHPDVYTDLADISRAYESLARKVTKNGTIIHCQDDKNSDFLRQIPNTNSLSYGFLPESDVTIEPVSVSPKGNQFYLHEHGNGFGPFTVSIPGMQNISNATAAILTCRELGVPTEKIKEGLRAFEGAKRRYETVGIVHGATIIDDYAHHPNEIMATLSATREWYPDHRLIVVFQPHTVSRTKSLLESFSHAFSLASKVFIADIYASAREQSDPTFTSQTLVNHITKFHQDVTFGGSYEKIATALQGTLKSGDIVLFMGAGDVGLWGRRFTESAK